jgi:hypothetical protein
MRWIGPQQLEQLVDTPPGDPVEALAARHDAGAADRLERSRAILRAHGAGPVWLERGHWRPAVRAP